MTEYADQPGCTGGKFVVVESSRSVSCPLNPFRKRRNILKKMTAVGVLVCIALFASLFFLMSNQAARGASDTVAAITQLENESVKADLSTDSSWVKKNLADDYIGGDSFGAWETRSETIKDAEDTSKNKTTSESMSDLKVTAYPGAAIARYKATYDRLYHGTHRARTIICTDTWIDESGAWKQAASHCSQTK